MTKPYYEKREITDFKDLINQSVSIYGNKNAFSVKGIMGEYTGIKYRELKKIDHTSKINLSLKTNAAVVLKESSTLSECGIIDDEDIHVEFQNTRVKPEDISKRIIHFYIIDGDDKHSRYAYIDNTLQEHLEMYRSNFSTGSDKQFELYFEGEEGNKGNKLDLTKSFLQLWIESEDTFVIKY